MRVDHDVITCEMNLVCSIAIHDVNHYIVHGNKIEIALIGLSYIAKSFRKGFI